MAKFAWSPPPPWWWRCLRRDAAVIKELSTSSHSSLANMKLNLAAAEAIFMLHLSRLTLNHQNPNREHSLFLAAVAIL